MDNSDVIYITIQGDMWDAICTNLCGSASYMPLLLWKNRLILCDDGDLAINKILLPSGVRVIIPSTTELNDNISTAYSDYLPPWSNVNGY